MSTSLWVLIVSISFWMEIVLSSNWLILKSLSWRYWLSLSVLWWLRSSQEVSAFRRSILMVFSPCSFMVPFYKTKYRMFLMIWSYIAAISPIEIKPSFSLIYLSSILWMRSPLVLLSFTVMLIASLAGSRERLMVWSLRLTVTLRGYSSLFSVISTVNLRLLSMVP